MTRRALFGPVACLVFGVIAVTPARPQTEQPSQQPGTPQAVPVPDESTLPEEDESVAPEKFDFNPLESQRNVRVGDYYWHKSKYRAALRRYEWATRYDPNSAKAFYKVAEAENKLNNKDAERLALKKVIGIAPDSKLAREAKKRLNKS